MLQSVIGVLTSVVLSYTIAIPDLRSKPTLSTQEFVRQAYMEIGVQPVVFEYAPAARSLAYSNEGVYDAEFARASDLASKYTNLVKIPFQLGSISFYRYTLPDTPGAATSPYLIALRGAASDDDVLAKVKSVTYVKSIGQGLKLLKSGRYGGFVSFCGFTEAVASELGIDIRRDSEPLVKQPIYHFVHKSRSSLVTPLAESFRKIAAKSGNPFEAVMKCPRTDTIAHNK